MLLKLNPNVWTDGTLVLDEVSGASSSGYRLYAHLPGQSWSSRRWCHLDDLGPLGGVVDSCGGFCSVPGPLQQSSSAVILALQASAAVHVGVDNLNVVRHVGRLLDGCRSSCPAC